MDHLAGDWWGLRHVANSIKAAANILLQAIVPHRCALCDAETHGDTGVCGPCFPRLQFIGQPACPGCARPLHETIAGRYASLCGSCLRDGQMFDHAVAAMAYSDAVANAVLRLKHGDRLDLAPLIARWMTLAWSASTPPQVDIILPVPLHWQRFVNRKYNQSLELARFVQPQIGGELMPQAMSRKKNTAQMKDMNREQRRQNVRGAFEIHPDFTKNSENSLRDKHVLIVDDVYTTGATLRAVAGTLRRAQVKHVSVLVAARVTRADI